MTREEFINWLGENAQELYTTEEFEELADQIITLGFPVKDGNG